MKNMDIVEESQMYKMIEKSLFSLCEEKPDKSINFLSNKLNEYSENDEGYSYPKNSTRKVNENELIFQVGVNVKKSRFTRKFRDYYTSIFKIGFGTYGTVFLAQEKKNIENRVAVKIINKEIHKTNDLSEFNFDFILGLDHPHIVRIIDIFDEQDYLYIVEEYCPGGDLFSYLMKYKFLSEQTTKTIVLQLLKTLNYLHKHNITHRDIKPENILIFNKEPEIIIKLGDFGNSTIFCKNKSLNDIIGTPYYIAPEVIKGNYNEKCDIWSTGVLVYLLLCGKPPFKSNNRTEFDLMCNILNKKIEIIPNISQLSKDFILKTMCRDVNIRLSANEALQHEWITSVVKVNNTLVAVEFLENIKGFIVGHGVKRIVYNYILSRKMYNDRNIQLMKLFELIDTDNSGDLDENELFHHYGKFFPGTDNEEMTEIRNIIKNSDINNSGKIEYSEFLIIADRINQKSVVSSIREIFDYFDLDKSNYIEASDLKLILNDDKFTMTEFEKIIEEFDINGDKKLSFNEFFTMLTQNFH